MPKTTLDQLRLDLEAKSAEHLVQQAVVEQARLKLEQETGKLNKLAEELAALDAKYVAAEQE